MAVLDVVTTLGTAREVSGAPDIAPETQRLCTREFDRAQRALHVILEVLEDEEIPS